jgi:hypothetical protein
LTLVIFFAISFPTAVVDNFGGLLALRFFQGFFGSPALANGGATFSDMYSLLIKPIEITLKDPAIFFVNIYTALFYGIYYTFFEVFLLVFPPMYGFNLEEIGLAFLACQVGATIDLLIYFAYLHRYMIPDNIKNGLRQQEHLQYSAPFSFPLVCLSLDGQLDQVSIGSYHLLELSYSL